MGFSGWEYATSSPSRTTRRPPHLRKIVFTDIAKKSLSAGCRGFLALFCLALPGIANATLGGNIQSIETDRISMTASMSTRPATQFTLHELLLPSGTKLKEFVSHSGVVFAIAWRGRTIPDLKQVLGNYYDRYVASDNRQGGLHNRVVSEADFVVQSGGHMRLFTGCAYLPQLLPPGVTVDQIQ
ncbi:MAG: DUF2844 domain-containing protein [Betaproteobacteria bacterium]